MAVRGQLRPPPRHGRGVAARHRPQRRARPPPLDRPAARPPDPRPRRPVRQPRRRRSPGQPARRPGHGGPGGSRAPGRAAGDADGRGVLRVHRPRDQRGLERPARHRQDPPPSGHGQAAHRLGGGAGMRSMTAMDCSQLADAAPELALGILPGDERAAAVAHLDECAHCQQLVGTYTVLTDRLLLLAPRAEPPPGFESQVVATMTAGEGSPARTPLRPPHPTARRRIPGAVLAVAACIIALLLALGVVGPSSSSPSVAAADMRTSQGDLMGQIYVHDGPPAKVFMSLPGWTAAVGPYAGSSNGYSLLIHRERGPAVLVPVRMSDNSTWAATVDGVDANEITSAALLDRNGQVWCSGTF